MINFNNIYASNSVVAIFEGSPIAKNPFSIYVIKAAAGFKFNDTFTVKNPCFLVLVASNNTYQMDEIIESGSAIPFVFAFSSNPLSLYDSSYIPSLVPVLSLDSAVQWIVSVINSSEPYIDLNLSFKKYSTYTARNGKKICIESQKQTKLFNDNSIYFEGFVMTGNQFDNVRGIWNRDGTNSLGVQGLDIVDYCDLR